MATIAISNLHPAGYDLFSDSESYMMALSEDELQITGGAIWTAASSQPCVAGVVFVATVVAGWVLN